jgi:hypothetical protein
MKYIFVVFVLICCSFFACKKKPDKRQTYLQGTWVLNKFLVNDNDSTTVQKAKKNYANYYIVYNDWAAKHANGTGWTLYANNIKDSIFTTVSPNKDFSKIGIDFFNFNLINDSSFLYWNINKLTNDDFQIEVNHNGINYKSNFNRN